MTKQQNTHNENEQLTPEEWSSEQLEHRQENDGQQKEPIDNRKTDGPNYPAT